MVPAFQHHTEHSARSTIFWAIKQTFCKFKRTEITSRMFSDRKGIKLDIDNKKTFEKFPKYLEIKEHTAK